MVKNTKKKINEKPSRPFPLRFEENDLDMITLSCVKHTIISQFEYCIKQRDVKPVVTIQLDYNNCEELIKLLEETVSDNFDI